MLIMSTGTMEGSRKIIGTSSVEEYKSDSKWIFSLVIEGVKRVLEVADEFYLSDRLLGRGTKVLEVKCIVEEVVDTTQYTTITPEQSWKEKHLVLKISFPSSERTKENELIDAARAHAKAHDADWALKHLPLVVACIDTQDRDADHAEKNTLQNRLKALLKEAYVIRNLHITVLEKLEPLSSLRRATEFAQVFYDILQIHRWLYEHPKILHRDLSMHNIMIRREGDKVYGVLNDFNLSSFRAQMDKDRTGTKPFMSQDLLDAKWDKRHLYRHDLESLFYIILIVSCHYSAPTIRAPSRPFKSWFDRADQDVAHAKLLFLQSTAPELPIQTYFKGFAPWIRDIHEMLGMGYKSRPGDFDGVEAECYDWDTFDGNVTYTEMMEVMGMFKNKDLVTRWDGGDEY
ncbi:hypothetical protein D9757_009230 [Collybiopsis confluens]|uniref:Protein kinase domain-containing protein n=1 Tax=Collybiopsis confluens TaxID=2823264 RepID=A0A8H5HAD3_9AGAR|nr:hypothetical protein D9757_009230 [Collybiopsis confluens]